MVGEGVVDGVSEGVGVPGVREGVGVVLTAVSVPPLQAAKSSIKSNVTIVKTCFFIWVSIFVCLSRRRYKLMMSVLKLWGLLWGRITAWTHCCARCVHVQPSA